MKTLAPSQRTASPYSLGHTRNEAASLNRDVSDARENLAAEEKAAIHLQKRYRGMAVRLAFSGTIEGLRLKQVSRKSRQIVPEKAKSNGASV